LDHDGSSMQHLVASSLLVVRRRRRRRRQPRSSPISSPARRRASSRPPFQPGRWMPRIEPRPLPSGSPGSISTTTTVATCAGHPKEDLLQRRLAAANFHRSVGFEFPPRNSERCFSDSRCLGAIGILGNSFLRIFQNLTPQKKSRNATSASAFVAPTSQMTHFLSPMSTSNDVEFTERFARTEFLFAANAALVTHDK